MYTEEPEPPESEDDGGRPAAVRQRVRGKKQSSGDREQNSTVPFSHAIKKEASATEPHGGRDASSTEVSWRIAGFWGVIYSQISYVYQSVGLEIESKLMI